MPFENSTYGPVLTTLDLFASSLKGPLSDTPSTDGPRTRYTDIEVCGEAFVQVRHFLLGYRPRRAKEAQPSEAQHTLPAQTIAPPVSAPRQSAPHRSPQLPSLANITRVLSHEQALGQCKQFLSTSLPHAEKKVVSSTSKAAELAAADETGETAAVCSVLAAEVYDLDILREEVQDRDDNATRFMVLRRRGVDQQSSTGELNGDDDGEGHAAKFKALVLFTVDHTSPGALADSLAIFKEHGLNLTSINTRPSGSGPWNYFFFVELEGICGEEERLQASLKELEKMADSSRCLGSWEVAS